MIVLDHPTAWAESADDYIDKVRDYSGSGSSPWLSRWRIHWVSVVPERG